MGEPLTQPLGEPLGERLGELIPQPLGELLTQLIGELLGELMGESLGEFMGERFTQFSALRLSSGFRASAFGLCWVFRALSLGVSRFGLGLSDSGASSIHRLHRFRQFAGPLDHQATSTPP